LDELLVLNERHYNIRDHYYIKDRVDILFRNCPINNDQCTSLTEGKDDEVILQTPA
jgi:hypothetical protein